MSPIPEKDKPFIRNRQAAKLESLPIVYHAILWGALAFVCLAVVWAYFATLDEITRGTGKVIPSTDIQVVQNLEGGILEEILVREGQVVDPGQVLMIIDDTRFSSSLKEQSVKIEDLLARIARLDAEVSEAPLQFSSILHSRAPQFVESEQALYERRQNELKTRVSVFENELREKKQELLELQQKLKTTEASFALVNQELNLTRPLVSKGAVSEVEVLRLERTANDLQGEIETARLAIPRLQAVIAGVQDKIAQAKITFRVEAQTELNEARAQLASLNQSAVALEDRVQRTLVRSPVRGTVNQINVNTIGGIIQPGEDLIEIVPLDDTLLIEAEIRPADIGFIRPGLTATVKLTAYDFSIYGGLMGQVEHISPDTILNEEDESVYQITVRTQKNYLQKGNKKLPIIPGMRAEIDILTGRKTVMDYLLKPILKTKSRALTEP